MPSFTIPPLTGRGFSHIDRGTTAEVWKSDSSLIQPGSGPVALKIFKRSYLRDRNLLDYLAQEIDIWQRLSRLHCPYIIELRGIVPADLVGLPANDYVVLEMELAEGTLRKLLRKMSYSSLNVEDRLHFQGNPLKITPKEREKLTQRSMRQLAVALRTMRELKIVHRDLKPDNILYITENQGLNQYVLKVADFGFAKRVEDSDLSNTFCGTPLYMAPEVLAHREYTTKADLWSVGVIAYEILCSELPFKAEDRESLKSKHRNHQPEKINSFPESRDLIMKLLRVNPEERISWSDFFKHPWLDLTPKKVIESRKDATTDRAPLKPSPFKQDIASSPPKSEFLRACELVLSLARQQGDNEALALYVRCGQDLQKHIEQLIDQPSAQSPSSQLISEVKQCQEVFENILTMVKQLRDTHASISERTVTGNLIFQYALQMGERAANKEVIRLYGKSVQLYTSTLLLLKYLERRSTDILASDKLQEYIVRFERRLRTVQGYFIVSPDQSKQEDSACI